MISFKRGIDERDGIDLSLVLTLILLILYSPTFHATYILIQVLCIAGIIHLPLCRRASFWLIITLLTAWGYTGYWFAIDNNKFLILYWTLALSLSFLTPDPKKAIAFNARILLGLTFLFAASQKFFSSDYYDGTSFYFLVLADERFKYLSEFLGGISKESLEANYQAVNVLTHYGSALPEVQLQGDSPSGFRLAQFLTWWTQCLESVIAMAFLWPQGKFISRWRDFPLLLFIFTTYIGASTAFPFGWILVALGIAQCTSTFKHTRFLYVLGYLFVPVYYFLGQKIFFIHY